MSRITSASFGAASTAADVAAGRDLSGKRAIVTGASAGIGEETARVLAGIGAEVVLAVRDVKAGQAVADAIAAAGGKASVSELHLDDLDSVRAFAAREGDRPLHLLIENAGIMACPLARTRQGFETQLGVNHVAHHLLATLLLPALESGAPSRVVVLSSAAHRLAAFDFEDPNFETARYGKWKGYGQSKTANALFALGFDRRYRDRGVRAFSVMPGSIETSIGRHLSDADRDALGTTTNTLDSDLARQRKTVQQGAATTVWAAIGEELNGAGGLYLEDCAEAKPAPSPQSFSGVQPFASDPHLADRLWEWTEAAIAATDRG